MHQLESRYNSGNSIPVLEITTPRALELGTEYYLNSEGSVIAEHEVLPVVMLPRVGSTIANFLPPGVTSPTIHQAGANLALGACPASSLNLRIELGTAPYAMYIHQSSSGTSQLRAVVMNERTGERVAEHTFNGQFTAANYLRPTEIAVGWAMIATDTVGLLCNHTTDTGNNYNLRVVRFIFNPGTLALTSSIATALGTAVAGGYNFIASGSGISSGKIACKDNASGQFVVNLVGNTINSAAGLGTINCQVEGQYVVTLGNNNSVVLTNLETNGATSFSATGSTWTGTPSVVVRLWPRVYLILQDLTTSNTLRLLTINDTFTAGVISVVANPQLPEFNFSSCVVLQQRNSSSLFHLIAATFDTPIAATVNITSAGAVIAGFKQVLLPDGLAVLGAQLATTLNGARPYKLDQPVVTDFTTQQLGTSSVDSTAMLWVKYRADLMFGMYKPKYLGRSLGNYAQGVTAELAGSPALLSVAPEQLSFQRVGRVIKVNDLKGLFLEPSNYSFGAVRYVGGTAAPVSPFPIDTVGFNYPIVFGAAQPVEGIVNITVLSQPNDVAVVAISPLGSIYTTLPSTAGGTQLDINFQGFLVLGIRISAADTSTGQVNLTYDVEAIDYV